MKKDETIFKERVQRDLKKIDNLWVVKIQQVSIRGIPDFIMCVCGYFVALELKSSEDAVRNKLQDWTLQHIGHCGGMNFIAWPENWGEVLDAIQHLSDTTECSRDGDIEINH